MLNRLALLALPLFAVALFAGCETTRTDAPDAGDAYQGARAVPVIQQMHGSDPALDAPRVTLIQDRPALDNLDADSFDELDVNFTEHDVVVFALGEQPTGGYWAHITGVQQVGDVLYVQGIVNQPGEDEAATQALTYPYAVAVIPKTDASIALSDIQEVTGETRPE
ncbi:MAG: protease complex subunit PrcB family protein [Phycisphaeraceae bacterium]